MAERKVNRKPQGGLQQFLAKGGIDIPFFALLIAIIVIGLVMLFSSTYVTAYYYEKYNHDPAYFFKRQLIWVLLGSVVMFAISHIELERFKFLFAVVGTAASWFFLGLALIMPAHNGTKRHVYLPGGIQFQPSDVAKFALILTLAALLSEFHSVIVNKNPLQSSWARKVNDFVNRPLMNKSMFIILICGGLILVYAALVAAGSHLSGTILILVIGVSMLYLGEVRLKWFLGGAVGATAAFMVLNKLGVLKSYMEERIIAWQDKSYEPLGARWQINQALYAIGSGGFMGKGLGQSTLKHLYVSEPQQPQPLQGAGCHGHRGAARRAGGAQYPGHHGYHPQHRYFAAVLQLRRLVADCTAGADGHCAFHLAHGEYRTAIIV